MSSQLWGAAAYLFSHLKIRPFLSIISTVRVKNNQVCCTRVQLATDQGPTFKTFESDFSSFSSTTIVRSQQKKLSKIGAQHFLLRLRLRLVLVLLCQVTADNKDTLSWVFVYVCFSLSNARSHSLYSLSRLPPPGVADQCDQIGRFLHFGQPFKAGGNNYFTQIAHIVRQFL